MEGSTSGLLGEDLKCHPSLYDLTCPVVRPGALTNKNGVDKGRIQEPEYLSLSCIPISPSLLFCYLCLPLRSMDAAMMAVCVLKIFLLKFFDGQKNLYCKYIYF